MGNALALVAGVITAMFVVSLGVFALLNLSHSQQQLKRMSANQSGSRESAQVVRQDADPFELMARDEPVITYVIFPVAAAAAGLIVGIVARKHVRFFGAVSALPLYVTLLGGAGVTVRNVLTSAGYAVIGVVLAGLTQRWRASVPIDASQ